MSRQGSSAEASLLAALEEEMIAEKSNHLFFGDCAMGATRTLTFTLRNLSQKDCYRFAWPIPPEAPSPTAAAGGGAPGQAGAGVATGATAAAAAAALAALAAPPARFRFAPAVGHLHAGCSKDVSVTFSSDQPLSVLELPLVAKLNKIQFSQGADKVQYEYTVK